MSHRQYATDVPTGLFTPAQIPLDIKGYFKDLADLRDLGTSDNLAYAYYEGMVAYCIETNLRYVWREVQTGETGGIRPTNFTYPNGHVVFDNDYSNRNFNFFLFATQGPTGDSGLNGAPGEDGQSINWRGVWSIGTYLPYDAIEYLGTSYICILSTAASPATPPADNTYWDILAKKGDQGAPGLGSDVQLASGDTTQVNGLGVGGDPWQVEVKNLQKEVTTFPSSKYTVLNTDHMHTIFLVNGAANIVVEVPGTLRDNFVCAFIQEGTGQVLFDDIGTAILESGSGGTGDMRKIKGQNFEVLLEKKLNTTTFFLTGHLKL